MDLASEGAVCASRLLALRDVAANAVDEPDVQVREIVAIGRDGVDGEQAASEPLRPPLRIARRVVCGAGEVRQHHRRPVEEFALRVQEHRAGRVDTGGL
jgi:hypothetical protein